MVVQELEAIGDLIKSEPPADRIESGEVEGSVTFWVAEPFIDGDVNVARML